MDGYFKLIRRIHTDNQIQPTGYLPWAECLLKYESSAIVNNTVYSKTEGIRTLLASVQESAADPDCNLDLAKAYLTDHGLLFPQTRERFYDSPARSLKRNLFARMDQASYQPSLATEQEHVFLQQAEAFRNENLSCWNAALPALKQYLHPDMAAFKCRLSGYSVDRDKLAPQIERLNHSFQNYLNQMELSCSPNVDTREIAIFFVCSRSKKDGQAIFINQPGIIFQLFRSPVHRSIYMRKQNLSTTIDDACVQYPLPITNQSLNADEELYHEIVSVCSELCTRYCIDFPKEAWNALWMCIKACVQCLSYQAADLFSVQYMLRQLLKFRESGYPVFDRWLEDKLSSETEPIYIPYWRALVKKLYDSSESSDVWRKKIATYRTLMENPSTDESEIFPALESLAAKAPRNQVATVPNPEEIEQIIAEINSRGDKAVQPPVQARSRKGPLETMRTAPMRTPYKTTISTRAVDMIHTEWLLLQCVCGQAQRELMEALCLLLSKTNEDPA